MQAFQTLNEDLSAQERLGNPGNVCRLQQDFRILPYNLVEHWTTETRNSTVIFVVEFETIKDQSFLYVRDFSTGIFSAGH